MTMRITATKGKHAWRGPSISVILLVVAWLLAAACSGTTPEPTAEATTPTAAGKDSIVTLGDIDPDEPTKKIERFTPLAEYLAENLQELGIEKGEVLIARDIEEMSDWLRDGTVDVFFDSPFPTLAVEERSDSEVILRRWKDGVVEYWSTYVSLRSSGLDKVDDLLGRVVAFEEPRSTSGFTLPAGTLIQRGFTLREVSGPDATVEPDEIGYLFSGDEENTFDLVLEGKVAAGGVSNEDYEELPAEFKQKLNAFDRTITVPRQLVSLRPGLDGSLGEKVRDLLVGLDQTEEGRQILEGLKKTKTFDELTVEAEKALQGLDQLIELVAND